MHELKEAAILAYDQLTHFWTNMVIIAYLEQLDSGLTYKNKQFFCICVDDIALKNYSNNDLNHFLAAIGNHYKYHIDCQGTCYMGLFKLEL